MAFFILHSAFCVLHSAFASELSVDPRAFPLTDLTTVTLTVDGPFASVDSVNVPLRNLAFVGEPWVSSEFAWMNGSASRRKTFRYRVRGVAAGAAMVGPVVLSSPDGQRETLPAVAVNVLADRISGSNDAETVLRELLASNRDPLFVVAEVDKHGAVAGEPVLVTWMLYNATTVQEWHIVGLPKLADFWVEELPLKEDALERVYVGGVLMQRLPIRRAALFPLHDGTLKIEGLTLEAAVMRRVRGGPFSMFEGELVDTSYTSAPVTLDVQPLPPGPPVDAVGDLALNCDIPQQRNGGPIVAGVTLSGFANVRAAPAPRLAGTVDGTVEVDGGETSIAHDDGPLTMTRRWRYLIFPAHPGVFEIPPIAMNVFVPATHERKELRCKASVLVAQGSRAVPDRPNRGGDNSLPAPRRGRWPIVAGIVLAVVLAFEAIPRARRALAVRRRVREIVEGRSAAEIRQRVDAELGVAPAVLLEERSDRGDAYRALRSLLEAAERERDIAVDAEEEIARRVREVLTIA
ncbi:MAG: BatD family protein [Acidobacteria bacterium]|nr:BatD family protein [Acidobacteriota bacterium]MBV9474836.1 BatD family protein [Acidobacteriota bacterium]